MLNQITVVGAGNLGATTAPCLAAKQLARRVNVRSLGHLTKSR